MKFTSIKSVASYVAKKEGKKSQAKIGDVREMLTILSKLFLTNTEVITLLVKNGKRIEKAKKKCP